MLPQRLRRLPELREAGGARVLVAASRDLATLAGSGVPVDVLVGSGSDAGERYAPGELDPEPHAVVRTAGAAGGSYEQADGEAGTWEGVPLPGPALDAYGAGDSFAAGLTFGLAAGQPLGEAVAMGAREGAQALTRRGAHGGLAQPAE